MKPHRFLSCWVLGATPRTRGTTRLWRPHTAFERRYQISNSPSLIPYCLGLNIDIPKAEHFVNLMHQDINFSKPSLLTFKFADWSKYWIVGFHVEHVFLHCKICFFFDLVVKVNQQVSTCPKPLPDLRRVVPHQWQLAKARVLQGWVGHSTICSTGFTGARHDNTALSLNPAVSHSCADRIWVAGNWTQDQAMHRCENKMKEPHFNGKLFEKIAPSNQDRIEIRYHYQTNIMLLAPGLMSYMYCVASPGHHAQKNTRQQHHKNGIGRDGTCPKSAEDQPAKWSNGPVGKRPCIGLGWSWTPNCLAACTLLHILASKPHSIF